MSPGSGLCSRVRLAARKWPFKNLKPTLLSQLRPAITSQPTGGTVVEGDIFTFSVLAEGAESIQWRKNGNNIAGATSSTYTIAEVTPAQAGTYTVVVGNASGSVTSNPAILK